MKNKKYIVLKYFKVIDDKKNKGDKVFKDQNGKIGFLIPKHRSKENYNKLIVSKKMLCQVLVSNDKVEYVTPFISNKTITQYVEEWQDKLLQNKSFDLGNKEMIKYIHLLFNRDLEFNRGEIIKTSKLYNEIYLKIKGLLPDNEYSEMNALAYTYTIIKN